jgi:hypothetical protein
MSPLVFNILRSLGILGTGLLILAVIYPSIVYRGKAGERYSLLNHFISELGEVGVSKGARVFNLGLILGGIALVPYILALGMRLASILGWLGTAAGVVATAAVACVGFYPMNNLQPHTRAAMTYFRAGLAMVFLFGLAILFQPEGHRFIPQAANLLSLVAVIVYAIFVFMLRPTKEDQPKREESSLDPQIKPERPRVWILPLMEWAVFFATILWLFGMAFFI